MKVTEIKPNMLVLEYKQEPGDEDYGTCLWARFTFNLDRYELSITSDCGNYGYKWVETSESFLHLMARCEAGYMLDKLYGRPNIFDYDKTKETVYNLYKGDEEETKALDEIFEKMDSDYLDARDFIEKFEEYDIEGLFSYGNAWEYPQYSYPCNAVKISEVFENYISPKIREILKEKT